MNAILRLIAARLPSHALRCLLCSITAILLPTTASSIDLQTIHTFDILTGGGNTSTHPGGSVIPLGSKLYGTTQGGFVHPNGTIFSMDLDGSNFQVVHSLSSAEGQQPQAELSVVGSKLYSTAINGGAGGDGTVFSLDPDGMNFQTLRSFGVTAGDGEWPAAGFELSGTTLISTTVFGGANGNGSVFSIEADGSNYQILHSFSGADGYEPLSPVTVVGSNLYGATWSGGANNLGSLFSMKLDGSNFQTLHSFAGPDGQGATSKLLAVGSTLYGAAYGGGPSGDIGLIFSIEQDGSNYQIVHAFSKADGLNPAAGLTLVDGKLYGTTLWGGDDGYGTIYSMNVDGSDFETLYSFTGGSDGFLPNTDLVRIGSSLYGRTSGGADGSGTVFMFQVPEPSSWIMWIVSAAALVGATIRHRSRVARVVAP